MDGDPERHPGEKEEQKSSCKHYCERVAWSSIVASILTVIGVVLVVVCVGFNSRLAGPLFSNTYIEEAVYTWFSWIEIGAYVGLVLMVALVILFFSTGCMATGYQNASTWCAFNKAQTGRRQLTAFIIVAYVVNLGWYVFLFGSAIPTVFFMMLHSGICTNAVFTASTCLDLRQFGLAPPSLPGAINSTLICEQNLQAICDSNLQSNFILGIIGCVLVLIGMNHFMMSIAGNYNWLRLRKRRQKLTAGKINRRSGTYDLSTSPYTERQESQDSNAHLRRVNLHHGSSSNILTSSNTSIPTVAANVPPAVTTMSSTFSMPVAPSSRSEPASNSSSMQSSKIYNQTYGFDDGGFGQQNGGSTRVTFADAKPTSTAAPRSNISNAAPRSNTSNANLIRSTGEDKNDLSKYADRSYDSGSRYDHHNPAFDENYWDQQQYAPPEQTERDNYYSRGYNNSSKTNGTATSYDQGGYNNSSKTDGPATSYDQGGYNNSSKTNGPATSYDQGGYNNSSKTNGPATSYDRGNFNQGYYNNYDYDAADNAGGYQMAPMSSYGQDNSQSLAQDRKAMGNNFYEYQL
ncbi:uncharacterized protein LOC593798 [Strongylocentrotus purpuratus]|uniref:Uncharacterized protein n=1 Tax=Strongylocentrotus purpuratus TaxID=7668 RepID=A0A7M7RHR2_STRPU|nr:uncharacterized protein LOC593798 [Strongylocentrotus purpuratus]